MYMVQSVQFISFFIYIIQLYSAVFFYLTTAYNSTFAYFNLTAPVHLTTYHIQFYLQQNKQKEKNKIRVVMVYKT